VAGLGPDRLRELGLSHAMATAIDGLAQWHLAGTLDTEDLDGLSDEQVVAALTATNGVGLWTARMFLIHQMRRPDVLPASDLGIRQPVERAFTLPGLPMIDEVREIGERWSPQCTYAVALLWMLLRPVTASA
jgi:DNA-3-methyladenine glycosylase II